MIEIAKIVLAVARVSEGETKAALLAYHNSLRETYNRVFFNTLADIFSNRE